MKSGYSMVIVIFFFGGGMDGLEKNFCKKLQLVEFWNFVCILSLGSFMMGYIFLGLSDIYFSFILCEKNFFRIISSFSLTCVTLEKKLDIVSGIIRDLEESGVFVSAK